MSAQVQAQTATIYQFPVRFRERKAELTEKSKIEANKIATQISDVAFGGGWYHDEAIRDDRTPHKS